MARQVWEQWTFQLRIKKELEDYGKVRKELVQRMVAILKKAHEKTDHLPIIKNLPFGGCYEFAIENPNEKKGFFWN